MRKYAWIYVIVAIVAAIWLYRYFTNRPVKTQTAYTATYEEKVSVSGFMLRGETVYPASAGGALESAVREGERVPKGKRIATVYKDGIDSKIKQELDAVNLQIERLQNTLTQKQVFSSDLAMVESQIKSGISETIDAAHSGNYGNMDTIKQALTRLSNRQTQISGETATNPTHAALEGLLAQRQRLESQIDSSKQDIYAQAGGIYSAVVDGLESVLVPDNVKNLTVTSFKTIKAPAAQNKKELLTPGEAACKTVDNSIWMSAALINKNDLDGIKEGLAIKLRFPDLSDEAIDAKVAYISPFENDQAVIAVSANRYLDSIYTVRAVNFQIIKNTYQGLALPISALRITDDKTGVYINPDGVARFREVDIIYKNDVTAIVRDTTGQAGKLKLYDSVIVNGTGIEDGKIVN